MLLADGVILVVAGVFLLGIVGFFFMAVALVMRLLGFVFRTLSGTTRAGPSAAPAGEQPGVTCTAPRCGNVNPHGARFCARCGRPLGGRDDVDAYG